jgi:hypothetical protein
MSGQIQPAPAPSASSLYERDYYEWLMATAEGLRGGRLAEVDLEQVAEELEDMGRSERRALASHLAVLMHHLLKWQHQPQARSSSWSGSIRNARDNIHHLLRDSPSLVRFLDAMVRDRYPTARLNAAEETGLPPERLPDTCPYTRDELLDRDFWPNP